MARIAAAVDRIVANVDKSIRETGEGRHLLQDRLKDSRFESSQSVVVQIHPRLVAIAVALKSAGSDTGEVVHGQADACEFGVHVESGR